MIPLVLLIFELLDDYYDARLVAYRTDMKEISKQTPTTITKPLSQRQKVQKIMTEICVGWDMKKITKGLQLLTV